MSEVMSVSATSAELFKEGQLIVIEGLEPGSTTVHHGQSVATLGSVGEVRSTIATANDVHFGEVECGKISGTTPAQFFTEEGDDPYPIVMNRSVIADIAARNPDAVIVKGDLTSFGTEEEYEVFCDHWVRAFGDTLTYVRGNHDSYPGLDYASWPIQITDIDGARVVLLDTSRRAIPGGRLDPEQLDALDAACAQSTTTVLVMGHHPIDLDHVPSDGHQCLAREDSEALLQVLKRHRNAVCYAAGHTHRCRRIVVDGISMIEVGAVKDFPGAWAEYQIGTEGISQVVRRASARDAIAWAEKTREMFSGLYGPYALGQLSDRCFNLPLER